ncbi:hypothetical protein ABB30_07885 [Stenotrophomonas ginsengisoli]|uniref:Uncharacterized protein n=1 Tax=Stenotrophomonas ginsengisoli TaxID=336566 RepID=A0A0R0DGM4_9GAMM|nr:hypothetical protein ABB30_07885 [Stenotrophomonas ginsengisoli]
MFVLAAHIFSQCIYTMDFINGFAGALQLAALRHRIGIVVVATALCQGINILLELIVGGPDTFTIQCVADFMASNDTYVVSIGRSCQTATEKSVAGQADDAGSAVVEPISTSPGAVKSSQLPSFGGLVETCLQLRCVVQDGRQCFALAWVGGIKCIQHLFELGLVG